MRESTARQLEELQKTKKKQARMKWVRLLLLLLPVVLLVVLLFATVPSAVKREQQYKEAAEALQQGNLDDAEKAFSEISNYRDSSSLVEQEIPYQEALRLFVAAERSDASMLSESGHTTGELDHNTTVAMLLYASAEQALLELNGYKDSAELARQAREGIEREAARILQADYAAAVAMLDAKQYSSAIAAFRELKDYEESRTLITEARYRKALGIFDFLSRYNVSRISAEITCEPGETTVFVMPEDEALRLGSSCIEELKAACGGDALDLRLTEDSGGLPTLAEELSDFFDSLDGYEDSASYPERIAELTDYTRDFFMLCSVGDLPGARSWLINYEGVFPEREEWLELLDLYLPFCGSWSFASGDPMLLPYIIGQNFRCNSVESRVLIEGDAFLLRLSFGDENSYSFDIRSENREPSFVNRELKSGNYLVYLNGFGRLIIQRSDGNWKELSASEYSPV